jgi:N-acetylglucosamine kinase-like BadF-type ATPase
VAIFLGIDGGGSKTSCLIGDEQSVLGEGVAAGSNVVSVGEANAKEALGQAIREACSAAKILPSQITRTCIGLAGAARPAVSELVRQMLTQIIAGEIDIVGDMVIAMEAAFGAGPGVIVIAGTGSIAYGRNPKGETARAGGWGFAVSDEGSGSWIGRSAVAAVLRAKDKNQTASLFEPVLKLWQLESHEQLVLAANSTPQPNFAALFPLVLSAAESGDIMGIRILTQAGNELADLAQIVVDRIFPAGRTFPLATAGGVLRSSALLRQIFYNRLHSEQTAVGVSPVVVEPVRGALDLARRRSL